MKGGWLDGIKHENVSPSWLIRFADILLTYFVSGVKFVLYSNEKFYNNLFVFCHVCALKPRDSDLNAGIFLF